MSDVIGLLCDRCGTSFVCDRIETLCCSCGQRTPIQIPVRGYARKTPLVRRKSVGGTSASHQRLETGSRNE